MISWRERLALLLGVASPFAVAGPAAAAAPATDPRVGAGTSPLAFEPLEFWGDPAHAGHLLQLAGHSSHRSHSSHSSHVSGSGHASHYSGTISTPAPVYAPPAPVYSPPAPVYSPPAAAPRPAPRAASSGPNTAAAPRLTQDEISKFVQRVQIALMVKGYDPGPADGELSPKTRDALKAFQGASGLSASGNMDKDTLHALGVLK